MNNQTSMLDCALELWEQGFHVIPVGSPHEEVPKYFLEQQGGDEGAAKDKWPKTPRIKWGEFQRRAPERSEVEAWWAKWPQANIAIVTGVQVDVVDADCQSAIDWVEAHLTRTPWRVKTAKGMHFYYQRGDLDVRNTANPGVGLDTRGEGGYVIAPTSTHRNGHIYEWDVDEAYDATTPSDLPHLTGQDIERIRSYTGTRAAETGLASIFDVNLSGVDAEALDWAPALEGGRNNKAAKLAGKLIWDGEDLQTARFKLLEWNKGNNPPLSVAEIETTLRSVVQTHQRKNPDQAIRTAPPPRSDEPGGRIHVWSIADLVDDPPEKPEYIWGGPAFFHGCRMLLAGAPKTGKSRFLASFLAAQACGMPFLGRDVTRIQKTLWLNAEIHKAWLPDRIAPLLRGALNYDPELVDLLRRNFMVSGRLRLDITNPADYLHIRDMTKGEGADTLGVDPLANFSGADENNNSEMRRVLDLWHAIQADTGVSLVLVHHTKKPQHKYEQTDGSPFDAIRGASALRGDYDTGCVLAPVPGMPTELTVAWEMRNGEPWSSHNACWNEARGTYEKLSFRNDATPPSGADLEDSLPKRRAKFMAHILKRSVAAGQKLNSQELKQVIGEDWVHKSQLWKEAVAEFERLQEAHVELLPKGAGYEFWVDPLKSFDPLN